MTGQPLPLRLRRRPDGTPVLDTRDLARATGRLHFNLLAACDKARAISPDYVAEIIERRQAGVQIPRWFELTWIGTAEVCEFLRNTKESPKRELIAQCRAAFEAAAAEEAAAAQRLLAQARQRGIRVVREDGQNRLWIPANTLPPEVEAEMERHRAALSAAIAACDPDAPDAPEPVSAPAPELSADSGPSPGRQHIASDVREADRVRPAPPPEPEGVPPCAGPGIMPFVFEDKEENVRFEIRAIDRNGTPWFIRNEVCEVLGLANPRDAISRLDEDERGVIIADTLGGPQEVAIISEQGLYDLAWTSRKPFAKRFRRWVKRDVLPAIRKTGRYDPGHDGQKRYSSAEDLLKDPHGLLQVTIGYAQRIIVQDAEIKGLKADKEELTAATIAAQAKIAELAPKAEELDELTGMDGLVNLRAAAAHCRVPLHEFTSKLVVWRYLYKSGGDKVAYRKWIDEGVFEPRIITLTDKRGREFCKDQPMVTVKGLRLFKKLFKPCEPPAQDDLAVGGGP